MAHALAVLDHAREMLAANIASLTIDEWLDAAGGFRSVLGIMKHVAGWSHVYHSYAFDKSPSHWNDLDWPRGRRNTIDPSIEYAGEIAEWFEQSAATWRQSVSGLADESLNEPRSLHWGAKAPLHEIVAMVAHHWTYHAGEINTVLAIRRGEAWELTEEVEENHIDTEGHRVRPQWMNE